MPQVNLSTLNDQELRQRLDWSRARGDAAVAYQILQEMAARRGAEAPKRGWTKRKSAEPRIVEVEMGDPLEKTDDVPPMPNWRPPSAEPAEPPPAAATPVEVEPDPAPPELLEPLNLRLVEPEPTPAPAANTDELDLRLAPEELEDRRPRARSGPAPRFRIAAGFAVGIVSGLGLGWWAAGMTQDAPAPAVAPVQMASLVRAPEPAPATLDVTVADPESALETIPEPPPPPNLPEEDAPAPEAATLEPEPEIEAAAAPAPAPRHVVVTKAAETQTAAAGACATEPTPADREICSDPTLQRLQRELRQAYSQALDAHEDRSLLRQRQLAWRDARSTVTDPDRLARLYEQRISKLYAAAAEARAQR